jgi:16S rRNA (guanine527-N7)-methyltransferase
VSRFEEFASELELQISPFLQIAEAQMRLLWGHYEMLVRWNRKISLTTVIALREAVERHYAESLFLASRIDATSGRIHDFGSGAGFPGYPVAVLKPGLQVELIESSGRKCAFLREACGGSGNVRVFQGRGEDLVERADWVVSRAVRLEEVLRFAASRTRRVALLCGRRDALEAAERRDLTATNVEKLPWGVDRVLLTAHVPRETA